MASVAVSRDWEAVFTTWSAAPSRTEQEKAENAERAIRKAIDANSKLSGMDIRVFPQGSYRNRTNVRQDSDVDICVCLTTPFITEYSDDLTDAALGFTTHPYTAAEFKEDVHRALRDYFGAGAVTPGEKAFDVHENTYRIDADVVPTLEYRWYYKYDGVITHVTGTALFTEAGGRIENYPEQNYSNGVAKNDRTKRQYKQVVRLLKRLRNEMAERGVASAKTMPSYLIECLAFNVPDEGFNRGTYRSDVQYVLAHIFNGTLTDQACTNWLELNEIKFLFRPAQPFTREQAHQFVSDAWDYIGLD